MDPDVNEVAPAELVGMFVGMGLPAVIAARFAKGQLSTGHSTVNLNDPVVQAEIAEIAVGIGLATLYRLLARFANGG